MDRPKIKRNAPMTYPEILENYFPNFEQIESGAYIHVDDPGESGYPGKPKRISITDHEGQLLQALVIGQKVLEIGTGLGVSAKAMAQSARHVWTCDTDEWVIKNIVPGLPSNVSFADRDMVSSIWADVVFIDGLHTRHAVRADIELALYTLIPRGRLIFHDTKILAVRQAIEEFDNLRQLCEFETEYGLGVYEKR